MTTTDDYRASLLAFRAAIRAVRQSPGPATLAELSRAALALPGGPSDSVTDDDKHVMLLRALEFAEDSQLFPRIDRMVTTVDDLSRSVPSWTPRPYAAEATADAVRLLAMCHEQQPDMEQHPLSPWTRAAETGTRLLQIILRRTDKRPADDLMVRTAKEFAERLRAAAAHRAVMVAAQFAVYAARMYGLFPIGPRIAQMSGSYVEWTRMFGTVRYRFTLAEGGWNDGFPHGRVTVVRTGSYESVRTFALTVRTRRKLIDQFVSSL
ncbi:hypothetical protein [Streptomyces rubradiris]|uniref:Uncharacterized protein n=1 Tax=Streptomyces rubradiris TaxID=285531 RepID=A0ABQ3RAF3_STRRR|nr:hypothetical protein [Streptomyces rubradiris]GHH31561.1 hypothetical protein GCM10018792_79390 [Streptomyces rubradiris]GHI52831.1 hypothetical protein Srubr_26770 [Streptomyces rubradiris]